MTFASGSGGAVSSADRSRFLYPALDLDRSPVPALSVSCGPLTGAALRAWAAVALPVAPADAGFVLGVGADLVAGELDVDLAAAAARQAVTGASGEVTTLTVPPRRAAGGPAAGSAAAGGLTVHLVGVGDGSARSLRSAAAALVRRALADRGSAGLVTTIAAGRPAAEVRLIAEALLLAAYRFSLVTSPPAALTTIELALDAGFAAGVDDPAGAGPAEAAVQQEAVRQAVIVARASWLARDLANTPAFVKSPQWLADAAVTLASDPARRLGVRVRDDQALAAEGFGGLIAVGAGSVRPPRLVEIVYTPERPAGRHVVVVGKGITFDSGGISLKPNESMMLMKTDMAAAGSVLAAMTTLAALDIAVRVTALLAVAENMPSGTAQRPGDVITQYGGRTVEIINTDAEGRLVLADALAYAVDQLRPDVLIDLATLTGAATLGLGRQQAALYTEADDLAAELVSAGETSGERVWRMPLVADYRSALDSDVADLAHVSRKPHVSGGSIVAALFLREFVGASRWAHLDIAGPARAEADAVEVTKGGTGYGVRLLVRWLEALADASAPVPGA